MLLSEAFNSYAQDVIAFRNQSHKTEENHFIALKSLIGYMGDIDISQLTFSEVRDWKISLEKRQISDVTIRAYLIKLRVVLGYLRMQGMDVLSPDQIPLPKRVVPVPQVLTPEDVNRLIESCRDMTGCSRLNKARNMAVISLLYSTGLRVSELCALNIADVKNDYFTVRGKGGTARLCFIDKRTRQLLGAYLRRRKDNNDALFISDLTKARIKPANVQEMFKYARRRAGFDWPIHPHTLRHSFATNMHLNGAPLYAVKEMMGHKSLETTAIYLHIWDEQLAETHKKYHTV